MTTYKPMITAALLLLLGLLLAGASAATVAAEVVVDTDIPESEPIQAVGGSGSATDEASTSAESSPKDHGVDGYGPYPPPFCWLENRWLVQQHTFHFPVTSVSLLNDGSVTASAYIDEDTTALFEKVVKEELGVPMYDPAWVGDGLSEWQSFGFEPLIIGQGQLLGTQSTGIWYPRAVVLYEEYFEEWYCPFNYPGVRRYSTLEPLENQDVGIEEWFFSGNHGQDWFETENQGAEYYMTVEPDTHHTFTNDTATIQWEAREIGGLHIQIPPSGTLREKYYYSGMHAQYYLVDPSDQPIDGYHDVAYRDHGQYRHCWGSPPLPEPVELVTELYEAGRLKGWDHTEVEIMGSRSFEIDFHYPNCQSGAPECDQATYGLEMLPIVKVEQSKIEHCPEVPNPEILTASGRLGFNGTGQYDVPDVLELFGENATYGWDGVQGLLGFFHLNDYPYPARPDPSYEHLGVMFDEGFVQTDGGPLTSFELVLDSVHSYPESVSPRNISSGISWSVPLDGPIKTPDNEGWMFCKPMPPES